MKPSDGANLTSHTARSHAVALLRGLAHELGRSEAFGNAKLFVQTGAQVRLFVLGGSKV